MITKVKVQKFANIQSFLLYVGFKMPKIPIKDSHTSNKSLMLYDCRILFLTRSPISNLKNTNV